MSELYATIIFLFVLFFLLGSSVWIGLALMEEYLPGRTENLHDYLIPTIGDVPEVERLMQVSIDFF